jgi:hypothetical protein
MASIRQPNSTDDAGQLTRDELSGGTHYRPLEQRRAGPLVAERVAATVAEVIERMDAYDNFPACRAIMSLSMP